MGAFGATVVAAYGPPVRPGTLASFPVSRADLAHLRAADLTIKTAAGLVDGQDARAGSFPPPRPVPADLLAHGRAVPVARVATMHEGKRRAGARRADSPATG
jgi:bifunctional non-homologous end joining protein LigD